ncbi:MAG: hypothetical protein OEO83_16125 [Alphaproteobacteria bacterium]|nr:hypothetical protein [Alphaproteobacteria bacterium]
MKSVIFLCGAAALLFAGPALANHCDDDIADVEWALGGPTTAGPNQVEAAEALLDDGAVACRHEEDELASADPDSPLLDPDFVTLGRSMLINAKDLLDGK